MQSEHEEVVRSVGCELATDHNSCDPPGGLCRDPHFWQSEINLNCQAWRKTVGTRRLSDHHTEGNHKACNRVELGRSRMSINSRSPAPTIKSVWSDSDANSWSPRIAIITWLVVILINGSVMTIPPAARYSVAVFIPTYSLICTAWDPITVVIATNTVSVVCACQTGKTQHQARKKCHT